MTNTHKIRLISLNKFNCSKRAVPCFFFSYSLVHPSDVRTVRKENVLRKNARVQVM